MKSLLTLIALTATILTADALTPRSLPTPDTDGGAPLMTSLARRHSTRNFDPRPLNDSTLGNLLWAAAGQNRPDGRRTSPTARNKQEIDIYLFDAEGVWLYDATSHSLIPAAEGDRRQLIAGGQEFAAKAPVSLLMVGNGDRFGAEDERAMLMMAADAGIVSQNINLFCASEGLATVPRATMDIEGITALLNLPASRKPLLNNPIGFPAGE